MVNQKRKEIFLLFFFLFIGFALRCYHLDQKSLWLDEVYTYNDSRDSFKDQIKFYKQNPVYLHPPLFFVLTHLLHPFPKPERDLRIIPLVAGTLSIPMIYLLARSFAPQIAIPCMVALTFMAYHISLSQDGRAYTVLIFFAMASLYFLFEHLKTSKKKYLVLTAFCHALLFYTSYSSIPFILFSQILWFYKLDNHRAPPSLSSFLIQNALTLLFILPWITFVGINYKGQIIIDPAQPEGPASLWSLLNGVLHDWVPLAPLMIASIGLLIFFLFFAKQRRNPIVLLVTLISPVTGVFLYCKWFQVTHFVTSRYFVTFLPLFFITLFLSLLAIEVHSEKIGRYFRPRFLFLFLFIASNLVILPLYYRYQKQDNRGLVAHLKEHLREGDKIFTERETYFPGILHYFGIHPKGRHHVAESWIDSENKILYKVSFVFENKNVDIFTSRTCCSQYVNDEGRVWIVARKLNAQYIKANSPAVLKGYFDGSFLNFNRFPTDVSMYLFLWDPKSPGEKGIEMPIE